MKIYKNLMVDNDERISEGIFDIDGKNLLVQIHLVSMKKLQIKNGLDFLNLFGQKVANAENLQMQIILSVKRI